MEIIFLIGRILFGGVFVMFGMNHFTHRETMTGYAASKKVPYPKFATTISGVLLVLGGLGIVFGVYTTTAIWLLVIFLIPTSFIMHAFWKETDPQAKQMDMINFMKNMALAGAALAMLSLPLPWAYGIL